MIPSLLGALHIQWIVTEGTPAILWSGLRPRSTSVRIARSSGPQRRTIFAVCLGLSHFHRIQPHIPVDYPYYPSLTHCRPLPPYRTHNLLLEEFPGRKFRRLVDHCLSECDGHFVTPFASCCPLSWETWFESSLRALSLFLQRPPLTLPTPIGFLLGVILGSDRILLSIFTEMTSLDGSGPGCTTGTLPDGNTSHIVRNQSDGGPCATPDVSLKTPVTFASFWPLDDAGQWCVSSVVGDRGSI